MHGRIYQLHRKPNRPGERGLPKLPVEMVYISHQGMDGDFNRYRHEKKTDSLERALLLLPLETIHDLNHEGWPVNPGDLGENITTEGIPYASFTIGNHYYSGRVLFKITEPCNPCTNVFLLPYAGERGPEFLHTLAHRRGWYARVLSEGTLQRGQILLQKE